jgi:hypothetical protein
MGPNSCVHEFVVSDQCRLLRSVFVYASSESIECEQEIQDGRPQANS